VKASRNPENILYDNIVLCNNTNMSKPPRRASRVFTISFPEELAKQVVAVAKDESRNISELFREAFRAYRFERMHKRLDAIRAEAAKRVTHHYTEDDVEALVDEIRAEKYARRKKTA
jgi:metal-responsive CopG/Arc/MetJ family transcriptional regulator